MDETIVEFFLFKVSQMDEGSKDVDWNNRKEALIRQRSYSKTYDEEAFGIYCELLATMYICHNFYRINLKN